MRQMDNPPLHKSRPVLGRKCEVGSQVPFEVQVVPLQSPVCCELPFTDFHRSLRSFSKCSVMGKLYVSRLKTCGAEGLEQHGYSFPFL